MLGGYGFQQATEHLYGYVLWQQSFEQLSRRLLVDVVDRSGGEMRSSFVDGLSVRGADSDACTLAGLDDLLFFFLRQCYGLRNSSFANFTDRQDFFHDQALRDHRFE